MKTLDFASRITEVVERMDLKGLLVTLQTMFDDGKHPEKPSNDGLGKEFAHKLMDANAHYLQLSAEAKEIATLLGLEKSLNTKMVRALIVAFDGIAKWAELRREPAFIELYTRMDSAVRLGETVQTLLVESKFEGATDGTATTVFELTDYGRHGVPPRRFAIVLAEIASLYEDIAEAQGGYAPEPQIIYIDSGTAFAIALRGGAKIIDSVANAFARCFNSFRYRDHEDLERGIQSAREAVAFLGELNVDVENNKIDAVAAEKIANSIKGRVYKLLGEGVTTPNLGVSATATATALPSIAKPSEPRRLGPGDEVDGL